MYQAFSMSEAKFLILGNLHLSGGLDKINVYILCQRGVATVEKNEER